MSNIIPNILPQPKELNMIAQGQSQPTKEIIKYNIPKTNKNTLADPLDIRKKEQNLDYIQFHLDELSKAKKPKKKSKNEIKEEENTVCLKVLGMEIYFKKNDKGVYEQSFMNGCGLDHSLLNKIRIMEDFELNKYITNVFSKYNYSPIITKLFSKERQSFENILKDTFLWESYISVYLMGNMMYDFKILEKKIISIVIDFINVYLTHIFSIPKVAESLNIISKKYKFEIFNFSEESNPGQKEILIDIEKELKGNGCSLIFLKELRRLYDCLFFSTNIFRHLFENCIFPSSIKDLFDYIFYNYIIENEVVSTLLFQIKMIFNLNENDEKEVLEFIKKFTQDLKNEVEKDDSINENFKELYGNDETKFPKKAQFNFREIKDFEKDYPIYGNETEFKEDEKIKEIKDIDELTKYIQGDKNKKRRKKKKRKENPINILDKLNNRDKRLEDDDGYSIYSGHDSVFSDFKRDIKSDMVDNKDCTKTKPVLSDKFIFDLDNI